MKFRVYTPVTRVEQVVIGGVYLADFSILGLSFNYKGKIKIHPQSHGNPSWFICILLETNGNSKKGTQWGIRLDCIKYRIN